MSEPPVAAGTNPASATIREIAPLPSDEEAVAIAVANHTLWPQPLPVTNDVRGRETAWKFSGRWWNRPVPSRRDRPHR